MGTAFKVRPRTPIPLCPLTGEPHIWQLEEARLELGARWPTDRTGGLPLFAVADLPGAARGRCACGAEDAWTGGLPAPKPWRSPRSPGAGEDVGE